MNYIYAYMTIQMIALIAGVIVWVVLYQMSKNLFD